MGGGRVMTEPSLVGPFATASRDCCARCGELMPSTPPDLAPDWLGVMDDVSADGSARHGYLCPSCQTRRERAWRRATAEFVAELGATYSLGSRAHFIEASLLRLPAPGEDES